MEMKYRLIEYEDSLTEQVVNMWRPSKELATGQKDIHSFEEDVHFIKNILSKDHQILLALQDESDKVLAMMAYTKDSIAQLYVDVNHLNYGIGTRLLNIAKQQTETQLDLFTFQRNDIARKFYEKHGFVEIGRNYENELNLLDIKYRWTKTINVA